MALFFVTALQTYSPNVDAAIQSKIPATDSYQIETGKWIVDAPVATSKDLSDFLDLTKATGHFVVPVRGYFGRSRPDFWEWLAAKTSKPNV